MLARLKYTHPKDLSFIIVIYFSRITTIMKKQNSSMAESRNPVFGYIVMLLAGAVIAVLFMAAFYKGPMNLTQSAVTQQAANTQVASQSTQLSYSGQKPSGNVSYELIEKTVPVLAVDSQNDSGIVENLTVKLIPGNGNILIDTSPYTETDLQYSTNVAAMIAKNVTNNNADSTDIIYTYKTSDEVAVIGGGSAGGAETIATIAALEGKSINPNVAMTGTINPDGTIGQVGGIPQKAKAAADAGYKLLLIPQGQSIVQNYVPIIFSQQYGRYRVYREEYNVTSINISDEAKQWGMDVKEVANIQDAMKYMLT